MSVEGMWAVYFGDAQSSQVNSGVAVLETGRVFGGDSMIAYLGVYEAKGGDIRASIKTWPYNSTQVVTTAFGQLASQGPQEVELKGTVDLSAGGMGEMTGVIWERRNPALKLAAKLVKIADLPS